MKTKSMAVFILLVYSTFTVASITQLCNLDVETSKYTNQWVETLASGTDRFFLPVEEAKNNLMALCNSKKNTYADQGVVCQCGNYVEEHLVIYYDLSCKETKMFSQDIIKKFQCDAITNCMATLPGNVDNIDDYQATMKELKEIEEVIGCHPINE